MDPEKNTPDGAQENGNQMITISRGELQAMIDASVSKAGEEGASNVRVMRRVSERKVEVRLVDNKVVLGYENVGTSERPRFVYEKPDPKDPSNKILYVNLILEGMTKDDKPLALRFDEFRREGQRASCKVIDTESKEWVVNQGMVRRKEVDGYTTNELDYDVPVDIIGKTTYYTVAIPNEFGGAREVKLHENYVNIA